MDLHHSTKARTILYLAKRGLNSKEIAQLVYPEAAGKEISTRMSYVRVVVRQRAGASLSVFDRAYLKRTKEERNAAKRERYRRDPAFRQKCLDGYRNWYAANKPRPRKDKARPAENQLTTA